MCIVSYPGHEFFRQMKREISMYCMRKGCWDGIFIVSHLIDECPIQSNQSTFITNKRTEKLVKTESTQEYYLNLWGFVNKTLLKYSCVFNCFGRKNNLIQYNCQSGAGS